jgi:hypothetical protein
MTNLVLADKTMSSAMPSILMPWTKRRDPMLFFPQEYKRMIWEWIMPCVKTSLYIERSDVESLQWAGTLAKLRLHRNREKVTVIRKFLKPNKILKI